MATVILAGKAMKQPDGEFRLSAEQRAALVPRYDADALESLLAVVPAAVRPQLLAAATRSSSPPRSPRLGAVPLPVHGGPSHPVQMSLPVQLEDFQFADPETQRLLEQVWAPRQGHHT